MLSLLLVLLLISVALNLLALRAIDVLGEKFSRQAERKETAYLQSLSDLTDKIAVMKGFREYAPSKPIEETPEELSPEDKERMEEGFLPY